MIKSVSIKNFRGIELIKDLQVDKFNILIGDNGTSKTSTLEAINFAFSPSFLSGKIKHTDFPNGNDDPMQILITLTESFEVSIPDGYQSQSVPCDKIYLKIKKRDKRTAGKIFSDLVTLEHVALPNFNKNGDGWTVQRKGGKDFKFTERSLAFSQVSKDELPRPFYFGKERDRQILKGYNSSFSTVIDDLNWRFSRSIRKEEEETKKTPEIFSVLSELAGEVAKKIDFEKNEVFKEFNKKTKSFGIDEIKLSIIDSTAPYEGAFLSSPKDTLDLPIKYLGSGIEMIIALLFLETMATLSKEKLLILIDEPELHLHPKLQEKLADYLLQISSDASPHQIFVTTHSPIFFKRCVGRTGVKTLVTTRDDKTKNLSINEISLNTGLFPWSPSWGEINYFAYGFPTIEFHDELYGFIQESTECFKEAQMDDYLEKQGIQKTMKWTPELKGVPGTEKNVTLPVFIRNKIHHPENKTMKVATVAPEHLESSIDTLIGIAKKLSQLTA